MEMKTAATFQDKRRNGSNLRPQIGDSYVSLQAQLFTLIAITSLCPLHEFMEQVIFPPTYTYKASISHIVEVEDAGRGPAIGLEGRRE